MLWLIYYYTNYRKTVDRVSRSLSKIDDSKQGIAMVDNDLEFMMSPSTELETKSDMTIRSSNEMVDLKDAFDIVWSTQRLREKNPASKKTSQISSFDIDTLYGGNPIVGITLPIDES